MARPSALVSPWPRDEVSYSQLQLDRRPHARKLIAYLAWMAVGAVGGFVDKVHERLGVIAYPNKAWLGERLPVSPMYVAATVAFFLLYTVMVGHRGRAQGIFGGRPISARDFLFSMLAWIAAYTFAGIMGRPVHGALPLVGAGLLAATALPDLWAARRTWLPLYATAVAVIGVGAEWLATARGAYLYPVCPGGACLGATLPMVWLFPLYLHAALLVHRLLGGRHWLSRRP